MNLLAQSSSPYLLQHKDNPVHWMAWGPDALQQAKTSGKPILVSIGYTACHWCHVMAKESFEDAETAGMMNELFVNVKVDREERPDVDTIFQSSINMMGEQGGWPLTIFLTPEGDPYWGGTYFPKEAMFGKPAFKDVLREVARLYRENGDQVSKNTQTIRAGLQRAFETSRPSSAMDPATLEFAMKRLCQQVDVFHGGLMGSPKFPNVPVIELLWRAFSNTGYMQFRQAVDTTLLNICQGGIYDHLGGGFSRYSMDETWMVPHFEKMLYDNAMMIDILTTVWLYSKNPLYRSRIEETVTWVLRDMVVEGGGFASSLDADIDGKEGAYYTWTEAEVDAALGKDAPLFKQVFDIRPEGNWDGRNIVHRLRTPPSLPAIQEGKLNALREKLLNTRNQRPRPVRDDKVLADWNGMMIRSIANAAEALNRADWQAAAVKAFWFVANSMSSGNRLFHASRNGQAGVAGFADDYAAMSRAALTLYEMTGHKPYLEKALEWVGALDTHFWRSDLGGYALTPDDAEPGIVRVRTVLDGATPAANGTMVEVHARLLGLTGNQHHAERYSVIVQTFADDARRQPAAAATYYNGFDLLLRAFEIVIFGDRNSQVTAAFRDVFRRANLLNRIVLHVAPGESLPAGHPAAGKGPVDGKVTVYVCTGQTCSLPVTDPVTLETQLKVRVMPGQAPSVPAAPSA
ncbi:MAG: thioredoxin domain-containing protein [Alphaproteobacteria bacterium]|nr:thioredoxin domain-containing protein [Alphaproteobacteria bacterium]